MRRETSVEVGFPELLELTGDPGTAPLVGVDAEGGPDPAELSEDGRPVPAGVLQGLEVSHLVPHHPEADVLMTILVQYAPPVATMEPVIRVELERVEALELLGTTLAHLNDAEARAETSPRVPLLMAIRNKLALGLREEI